MQNISLLFSDCCDRLFDMLDNYAENNNKKRIITWPLQMMLLILCAVSKKDIFYRFLNVVL